ncbi:LOW QUALITY PROTEIN: septum-promoting GTP-binding protein 1 [Carica papaya]|uniref:LOW QUALITY PROTEIN: septum-promoting GTP-binding protein 1 n=1 Tax=Carica papaya TaxID=3649 RepID=UPI000B8C9452|nr:LOW QUALITY PROTEIN: septum-promoting GTP-binding protein 1 [Carica papaya]
MAKTLRETLRKMTRLCRNTLHLDVKCSIAEKVSIFSKVFRFIWEKILVCSIGNKPASYRRLTHRISSVNSSPEEVSDAGPAVREEDPMVAAGSETDSDLVTLKISLLGDCQIGKTSFVVKYVGDERERCLEMTGLNLTSKTLSVQGARISFSIWDVGGDSRSLDQVPIACKDAVAILFMFDLTSRCTLNSVIEWYGQARKWNQTAIPILIGTKFDVFSRLPLNLQWTIVMQARAYAKAMKASLFFSSATHNINVNKIFKFIMAKLFNLPWSLDRNLTIGEPIIDFQS